MKKARKVHFVLADPKVNYGCTCGCVLMKTVRNYDEQDTLACTPQLSDQTQVTMWAPHVTCVTCLKAMRDDGLIGDVDQSDYHLVTGLAKWQQNLLRDATIDPHQK